MKKILYFFVFGMFCLLLFLNTDEPTKKLVSYNGNNLRISIDGEVSSMLPTSGSYYLADYDCSSLDTKLNWDKENYKLSVSNGTKKTGLSCYLEFSSKPLLSQMEVGSYVKYVGDNGCEGNLCEGYKTNYIEEMNNDPAYKFTFMGWRIAYVKNNSAYLISAGVTEKACTNENNEISHFGCLASGSWSIHESNLDNISLKYCNNNYSKNGICDVTTTWGLDGTDFKNITGNNIRYCSSKYACGYGNDMFNIDSDYWINQNYATNSGYYWITYNRYWKSNVQSASLSGIRPILYLDSSVIVTGGSGTSDDPYLIDNNYFDVEEDTGYVNGNDDLSAVTLYLHAIDEDITKMCISVDTSECTNYIDFSDNYTLDWSSEEDGEKIIYVYYKNSNGKIVSTMNKSVIIDTAAPIDNSVTINETDGMARTLTLSSTNADYICLSNTSNNASDCTEWVDYTTSYNWFLTEGTGTKNIYVFFKDEAGNVADVVSSTTTCTNDCEYKYYMDALNSDNVYLIRSDGATAKVTTSDTSITWYTKNSQALNTCSIYNYTDNATVYVHYMCIGEDNNIYFKRNVNVDGWINSNSTSYINTSTYNYFTYVGDNNYNRMMIIRNDGKIKFFGIDNGNFIYGPSASIAMANCSGSGGNRIVCISESGKYYYRTAYNTTDNYLGGVDTTYSNRTNLNTWIDMKAKSITHLILSEGNTLYNASFNYNATSLGTMYESSITGGVKTCASAGNADINYCIGNDDYLYYKNVTDTTWTKTGLSVS